MRNLIPILLLVTVSLWAGGCDSLLNIDPQQSIDEDRALETPENVEATLIGAYDYHRSYYLFGGQLMMIPDLVADAGELTWSGTYRQPREAHDKSFLIDNSYVANQWINGYRTINVANNVLDALGVIENEEQRERLEGEARFLRGTIYFELVRLFAPAWNAVDPNTAAGIPLVTEPTRTIGEEQNVARATIAEVYDQAIADLEAARDLIVTPSDVRADSYAASAVLSRLYLMRGDYEEAATEASRVIESDEYDLADSYEEAFNRTSNIAEYVYAVQVTSQDGSNSLNTFYAPDEFGGRGDIEITDTHIEQYEEDDERLGLFYTDEDGERRTGKWTNGIDANIPVVRLAELYLTRAEANLRAGSSIGADPVDDVNAVRERAGLGKLDPGDVTPEAVWQERKLELMFEGHLLHDLKRTEQDIGELSFDAPSLVYPIPQRELDANPALEQNDGYGS